MILILGFQSKLIIVIPDCQRNTASLRDTQVYWVKLARAGQDRKSGRKEEEVPEEVTPELDFEVVFLFVRMWKLVQAFWVCGSAEALCAL